MNSTYLKNVFEIIVNVFIVTFDQNLLKISLTPNFITVMNQTPLSLTICITVKGTIYNKPNCHKMRRVCAEKKDNDFI